MMVGKASSAGARAAVQIAKEAAKGTGIVSNLVIIQNIALS
jgi:hypothetical protein